jgi:HAD superfamily hydrolase (TIGR01549 family)
MIKNVVFDLGNVLISFRPSEYLSKNGYSSARTNIILNDIFGSREWLLLDDGKITISEAVESIAVKSSLKKEEIDRIFNERIKIFHSLDNNARILPALKKQGFKLYYISNFPGDIFDEVKRDYDFFGYFNGGIISAHVRHSKPDTEIFRIFLNKFDLVADECLYIDDIENNVSAAISVGMSGYFTHGSEDISEEVMNLLREHSSPPG